MSGWRAHMKLFGTNLPPRAEMHRSRKTDGLEGQVIGGGACTGNATYSAYGRARVSRLFTRMGNPPTLVVTASGAARSVAQAYPHQFGQPDPMSGSNSTAGAGVDPRESFGQARVVTTSRGTMWVFGQQGSSLYHEDSYATDDPNTLKLSIIDTQSVFGSIYGGGSGLSRLSGEAASSGVSVVRFSKP